MSRRSTTEIIAHGQALGVSGGAPLGRAARAGLGRALADPTQYRRLVKGAMARAQAEAIILQAVTEARTQGYSWATIGAALGTSGEAARQRYARVCEQQPTQP